MYSFLLRIQFTLCTQIKPLQMAFGLTTNIMYLFTYYLLTYWHRLAVFNSDALVAYERLHRLALL